MKPWTSSHPLATLLTVSLLLFGTVSAPRAQQKDLPEVTIATAVSNMAFAALWVAEQLKYFEQEGVRAKITVAGGGSPCQSAVVGRSVNFCASSSEGLVLAHVEGAPLIAVQAHNRNLTLSVAIRKEIVDKLKLTRKSPLGARLKALSQLGPIGATSPGAVSEQIFKFLVAKAGGDPSKLKFVYLGGPQLPSSLMNNVIDAFALSPPSAELTEAAGKGYVLLPLGLGEVPELTDYPYEVLMARPDYVEANSKIAVAVSRAISRGGALFHSNPEAAKAALRAHRFSDPKKLDQKVFDLSVDMVRPAMPRWGNMTSAGWKKVIDFAAGAGIVKDASKIPPADEGVLWTNKYVGKP
ncbi:MAG TPA: ABC transporter substrate-binding protein [candidate division Zixibacteria bacterium]|nr:ABC transporter substrate-binding protein [candidate division Zixibacteria bacterium]